MEHLIDKLGKSLRAMENFNLLKVSPKYSHAPREFVEDREAVGLKI
jgi:hypothetical protein